MSQKQTAKAKAEDAEAYRRWLQSDDFTWIGADKDNARKIIHRAMAKHWWFQCSHKEDRYVIILSRAIDLEKDIRSKIEGVQFELV